MEIRWHGHSCFTLTYGGYRIVLDPYADGKVDGYPPLRLEAEEVLTTHGHGDHAFTEGVKLSGAGGPSPFTVRRFGTWHDDAKGAKRGANDILLLEAGGLRAVHLGDLGCRPDEAQLEAISHADALMIPVGGFYTIDAAAAKELVERLEPRVVIPMHYRGGNFGFSVLAELRDFTKLFPAGTVRTYESSVLTLGADTPRHVAVLRSPAA